MKGVNQPGRVITLVLTVALWLGSTAWAVMDGGTPLDTEVQHEKATGKNLNASGELVGDQLRHRALLVAAGCQFCAQKMARNEDVTFYEGTRTLYYNTLVQSIRPALVRQAGSESGASRQATEVVIQFIDFVPSVGVRTVTRSRSSSHTSQHQSAGGTHSQNKDDLGELQTQSDENRATGVPIVEMHVEETPSVQWAEHWVLIDAGDVIACVPRDPASGPASVPQTLLRALESSECVGAHMPLGTVTPFVRAQSALRAVLRLKTEEQLLVIRAVSAEQAVAMAALAGALDEVGGECELTDGERAAVSRVRQLALAARDARRAPGEDSLRAGAVVRFTEAEFCWIPLRLWEAQKVLGSRSMAIAIRGEASPRTGLRFTGSGSAAGSVRFQRAGVPGEFIEISAKQIDRIEAE